MRVSNSGARTDFVKQRPCNERVGSILNCPDIARALQVGVDDGELADCLPGIDKVWLEPNEVKAKYPSIAVDPWELCKQTLAALCEREVTPDGKSGNILAFSEKLAVLGLFGDEAMEQELLRRQEIYLTRSNEERRGDPPFPITVPQLMRLGERDEQIYNCVVLSVPELLQWAALDDDERRDLLGRQYIRYALRVLDQMAVAVEREFPEEQELKVNLRAYADEARAALEGLAATAV